MARNVVEFVLLGKDQVSTPFGKAMATIRKASAVIGLVTGATAAAGAAVFRMAKDTAAADDALGKFAERLGTSADVIGRFHELGQLAGITTNTMDLALQRMNRRLGDAINQGGAAAEVFSDIGLNAAEVANLPLPERFEVISDALNTVEGSTQRLSAAVRIFDSEGAAMIQLTNQGSEAIRKMSEDMDFLGATVTPQAAANAAQFNDQLFRFSKATEGVRNAITRDLYPIFAGVVQRLANFIAANREHIVRFVQDAIINVTAAVIYITNAAQTISNVIDEAFNSESTFERFRETIGNIAEYMVTLISGAALEMASQVAFQVQRLFGILVEGARVAWENIKRVFTGEEFLGFEDLLSGMRRAHDAALADYQARAEILKTATAVQLDATKQQLSEIDISWSNAIDEARNYIGEIALPGVEIAQTFEQNVVPSIEAATEKTQEFQEALSQISGFGQGLLGGGEGIEVPENLLPEIPDYTQTFEERIQQPAMSVFEALYNRAQEFRVQAGNVFQQLGDGIWNVMGNTINMISSGFAQVLTGTRSLFDVMKQVGIAVLQQVIATFIRVGLQRLVLNAINQAATTSESSASLAKGLAEVYTNSFASAAAIPLYGWAIAPGIAAANFAAATAGATAAGATGAGVGAGIAGQFHSGVDFVPREGSFLLDRGERVLSSDQNKDLTDFMESRSSLSVQNMRIEVLPNATSADALLTMTDAQIRDIVEQKIIRAMDQLSRKGIKPERR